MKFTIREMLLVTLVAGVLLGWLVDHWRSAGRDAAWEKSFEAAAQHISNFARKGASFETPSGSWRVFVSGDNSEHGK
jgi:hypothetical protein